jgi:hypothetical protein
MPPRFALSNMTNPVGLVAALVGVIIVDRLSIGPAAEATKVCVTVSSLAPQLPSLGLLGQLILASAISASGELSLYLRSCCSSVNPLTPKARFSSKGTTHMRTKTVPAKWERDQDPSVINEAVHFFSVTARNLLIPRSARVHRTDEPARFLQMPAV